MHNESTDPVYSSGVKIVALIQGSSILSISVGSGKSAGLCNAFWLPFWRLTLYTTDGAVAMSSKLNSLFSLSLITSICKRPKNPHLNPKPKAAEVSASNEKELSLRLNFNKLSLSWLNSEESTGNKPQKTTGTDGLKPGRACSQGFLSSVIVSPTLQSDAVLMLAVIKPISPGPK